jgi:glutamyl-tRNA reductase
MIKNNTSSTKEQANKIKEVIQEELNNLPNWVKDAQEPRKQVLKELLMWFENDKNIIC